MIGRSSKYVFKVRRHPLALGVALFLQALSILGSTAALAQQDLEEVVVTARKREEKLLDVPIAITALSGSELAERGLTTINDIVQAVPGVQVASNQGKNSPNISIRGIGMANQFSVNAATPVGLYMDEVYQTFHPAPDLQEFDLERVEVLRGPQGTLFGHNTTAGSVGFFSETPRLDGLPNGYATLGYGNFNDVLAEGATDVTIDKDKLGLRVAAQYERRDGYMENLFPGGKDGGAEDSLQGRILLRSKPSDDLDIILKVYGGHDHGTQSHAGLDFATPPPALPRWRIDSAVDQPQITSQYGIGLNTKWSNGSWAITSVSAYDEGKLLYQVDCDESLRDFCMAEYDTRGTQASQDLRVNYDTDRSHAVAGAYYGWDRMNFLQLTHFNDGALFNIRNIYVQTRNTEAVYGEETYDVTDAWSVTAGLRYTFDQNQLSKVQAALTDVYNGAPLVTTVPGGPYSPTAFLPTKNGDTDGLTGRAILQYKFDTDKLAYVSFSHGYRAGNFNGSEFFSPAEANFVAPEKINTYELGVKGHFLDHRLTLATATFLNDLTNQQVATQVLTNGTFSPGLGSLNGHSYGLEIEMQLQVLETLRLTGNMSLLRSRYDDNQVINGNIPVGGDKFPFTPAYTALGQVDWTVWQRDDRKILLRATANYMGHYFYDPQNGSTAVGASFKNGQKPYTLVDARLAYDIGNYDFSIWGRNLTDAYYASFNADAGNYSSAYIGLPRTFGVQVNVKF
jgi:outer membrane receptor protein involved in Fe transport